ncbi:hypothetical protein [Ancylobacter lacus]|uniref:hypothetical protein n=1 Tax=Ancylobacter lacus TaxID=2579970 RepID=UPI001BCF9FFA|nr:hypothetical protein [Ancylobacter lacus]MBS7538461.1 hypothetical protein [Ancylobacter lacus]
MSHLILVIVTLDVQLQKEIEQRRAELIPDSFRKNGHTSLKGERPIIKCFKPDDQVLHAESLMSFVNDAISDTTIGIIVILDNKIRIINQNLFSIFFIFQYEATYPIKSPKNFMGEILSRSLKIYRVFSNYFDDLKYKKIFTLPLRNFEAEEIFKIKLSFVKTNDNLIKNIETQLHKFRSRQSPKRYSDSQDVYIVDDDGKYFRLGHERHAMAETKIPPHNIYCVLANRFRFGRLFDGALHYNVSWGSKNTAMNGSYKNCHNEDTPCGGRSHLNMFANDFF